MVFKHDPFCALTETLPNNPPLWASTIALTAYCPNYAFLSRFSRENKWDSGMIGDRLLYRAFQGWIQAWVGDVKNEGIQTHKTLQKTLDIHLDFVLEEFDRNVEGPEDFLTNLRNDIQRLLSSFSQAIFTIYPSQDGPIESQDIINYFFGGELHCDERIGIYDNQIVAKSDMHVVSYQERYDDTTPIQAVSVLEVKRSALTSQIADLQAIATAMVLETHYQAPIRDLHVIFPSRTRIIPYSEAIKARILHLASQFLSMADIQTELYGKPGCCSCPLSVRCKKLSRTTAKRRQEAFLLRNDAMHERARSTRTDIYNDLLGMLVTSQQLRQISSRNG